MKPRLNLITPCWLWNLRELREEQAAARENRAKLASVLLEGCQDAVWAGALEHAARLWNDDL